MKRRIIRAATAVTASSNYPREYIELQQALHNARKLIDRCVDKNLEGYIDWDVVSKMLSTGVEAISKACRDLEENEIIESTTSIRAARNWDKYPAVAWCEDKIRDLEDAPNVICVVVPHDKFNDLPDNIKKIIEDNDLILVNFGGEVYIDMGDRIQSVSDEDFYALQGAGISTDSNTLDIVQLLMLD